MEVGDITEKEFHLHLNKLRENFKLEKKRSNLKLMETRKLQLIRLLSLNSIVARKYSLILDYRLNFSCEQAESNHKLYLLNKFNKDKKMMGWLDIAQWHPLCIAPEEFDLLLKYWKIKDQTWKGTCFPKLILKGYVGHHNPTQAAKFRDEILEKFVELKIDGFEDYKDRLSNVHFYGSERYKWLKVDEFGWVYESDVYNCYSIRNECHYTSGNENFPFQEWNEMIKSIEAELNLSWLNRKNEIADEN